MKLGLPRATLPLWLGLLSLTGLFSCATDQIAGTSYAAAIEDLCQTNDDCPDDLVCGYDGYRSRCMAVASCGLCASPGECRGEDLCIQPDLEGRSCEFDDECGENYFCIAGYCTWDPRIPPSCINGQSECPENLTCNEDGFCVCLEDGNCAIGFRCGDEGTCVPETRCGSQDDCREGLSCVTGRCVPGTACEVVHPNLEGNWTLETTLDMSEIFPEDVNRFFQTLQPVFAAFGGSPEYFRTSLPDEIDMAIGEELDAFSRRNLPGWARSLFSALDVMARYMGEWLIEETMVLTEADRRDFYNGTHTWETLSIRYGERSWAEGTPSEIVGVGVVESEFTARAVCGTLVIDEHNLRVNIGELILWFADQVVRISTDNEYDDLRSALRAAIDYVVTEVIMWAEDLARSLFGDDLSLFGLSAGDIADAAGDWLRTYLRAAVDVWVLDTIRDATAELGFLDLAGTGIIASERAVEEGVWELDIAGADVPGTFEASKAWR